MVPTTYGWDIGWKAFIYVGFSCSGGRGSTKGLRGIWGVRGLRGVVGDSEGWVLGWIERGDSLASPVVCRHLTKCKYTPIYCQNVQKVCIYVLFNISLFGVFLNVKAIQAAQISGWLFSGWHTMQNNRRYKVISFWYHIDIGMTLRLNIFV